MRLRAARDREAAAAQRLGVAAFDVFDARMARRVREDVVDERAQRVVLALGVELEPLAVTQVAHGSRDGVTRGDALHGVTEADRLNATAQCHDRAFHRHAAARGFVILGYVPRMDAARFPAVTGEALDGTPFSAPRDFAGMRTVALIGFALEHRPELETWVPYLDVLVRRGGVRARLFAGLGVPKLVRKGIVAAMKAAVTAPELRAATIPLFVDVDAFSRALGIGDRAHLTILLVEPDARIVWRGSGPFSEAAGASLTAALAA